TRLRYTPKGRRIVHQTCANGKAGGTTPELTSQDKQQFFQFQANLADHLLRLSQVFLGLIARQALAGSTDGEALVIQQRADLADQHHVVALIVAAVAAPLDRLELRKLLFPIAEHVRLDRTELTYFADSEISFGRDR